MIEQLLAHIPLHIGTHHMSLVADVIFAETLYDVHDEKCQPNPGETLENPRAASGKQGGCHGSKNLRIGQIHQADDGRTDQIQKEDAPVRTVVMNKFL